MLEHRIMADATHTPIPHVRRRLLATAAAAAAAVGTATQAASLPTGAEPVAAAALNPDAALLRHCAEHDRLAAECWALEEPWTAIDGGAPPAIDRQARALGDAAMRLRQRIVGIPAHTGPGLAAKARIVLRYSNADAHGELDPDSDDAMAWSLSQDLVRLFGEGRA
jgi:hypothetical protein